MEKLDESVECPVRRPFIVQSKAWGHCEEWETSDTFTMAISTCRQSNVEVDILHLRVTDCRVACIRLQCQRLEMYQSPSY
jgi:hypothetical protein